MKCADLQFTQHQAQLLFSEKFDLCMISTEPEKENWAMDFSDLLHCDCCPLSGDTS